MTLWHDDTPRPMTPAQAQAMTQQCIRVTYPDDVTPQAKRDLIAEAKRRATATGDAFFLDVIEALQCSR